MTSPTATITGRVVGPDGLGRLGRVAFCPVTPTAQPQAQAILAGRASFRIDPDGYLAGPEGRSVTVLPGDYEIDLNIPGDSGAHIRRRVTIAAGQSLTLADLLTTAPSPTPPPTPWPPANGILTPGNREVRHAGRADFLEAVNPAEVVDLGNGILTWRSPDGGLVSPDGRGVRDVGTSGILEAMDKAAVIDLGNGALTWR